MPLLTNLDVTFGTTVRADGLDMAIRNAAAGIEQDQLLQENGKVVFRYENPNAEEVYIAGEFNNWNKNTTPMKKSAGLFIAELDLAPGKYLYKFVVDGNWIADPYNPNTTPDGYGGINSVVTVE